MDSPALLANENVPAPLVPLLQSRGLTVHAVADIMPMASDRASGRSQWPSLRSLWPSCWPTMQCSCWATWWWWAGVACVAGLCRNPCSAGHGGR